MCLGDRSPRQPERHPKKGWDRFARSALSVATVRDRGSGNYESDQARAKQDKTGNGHSEETVRSEFIAHGTPPTVCAPARTERLPLCTVKGFPFQTPSFDPG